MAQPGALAAALAQVGGAGQALAGAAAQGLADALAGALAGALVERFRQMVGRQCQR